MTSEPHLTSHALKGLSGGVSGNAFHRSVEQGLHILSGHPRGLSGGLNVGLDASEALGRLLGKGLHGGVNLFQVVAKLGQAINFDLGFDGAEIHAANTFLLTPWRVTCPTSRPMA